MSNGNLGLEDSVRAGYELREGWVRLVVSVGVVMTLAAVPLELFLWQLSIAVAPAQRVPGAAPPVEMPGEPPLDQRLEAIRPPRLDPLQPLTAVPPSYRSSQPVAGEAARRQHPQDLWPNRQGGLHEFRWVEPGKIARIPIDQAMDAVVDADRAKRQKQKEEKK